MFCEYKQPLLEHLCFVSLLALLMDRPLLNETDGGTNPGGCRRFPHPLYKESNLEQSVGWALCRQAMKPFGIIKLGWKRSGACFCSPKTAQLCSKRGLSRPFFTKICWNMLLCFSTEVGPFPLLFFSEPKEARLAFSMLRIDCELTTAVFVPRYDGNDIDNT